jgi:hypothetical protein
MKKPVFCLIILGLSVTAAWGQSIGVGGYVSPVFFAAGFENRSDFRGKTIQTWSLAYPNGNFFGGGGFVFFDINYLETSVGVYSDSIRQEMRVNSPLIEPEEKFTLDFTALSLGLMGKYTFLRHTRSIRLFPQLGVEYNLVLSARLNGVEVDNPLDWSHLWIKTGLGIDFLIKRTPLFIRLETFFIGILLPSKAERDLADNSKRKLENFFHDEYGTDQNFTNKTFSGFGTTLRVAVGFRL